MTFIASRLRPFAAKFYTRQLSTTAHTLATSNNVVTVQSDSSKGPLSSYVNPKEALLDTTLLKQGNKAEFALSSVDKLINWAQTSSIWPMTFGLACCAVEMVGLNNNDLM